MQGRLTGGIAVETTAPARSLPLHRTFSTPRPADPVAPQVARPPWLTVYTAALVVLDATAMAAATLTAKISWLGINPESFHIRSFSIPYGALTLATVPAWIVLLALAGAYDLGPFGTAPRTWMQVVRSGAQLLAVVAVAYYILHLAQLGRGVLVGLIPLAVALTLGERAAARLVLDQLRRRGHARRTALLVGNQRGVDAMCEQTRARPESGVSVVGVSVIGTGREDDTDTPAGPASGSRTDPAGGVGAPRAGADTPAARANGERPDLDRISTIARALARTRAETVIVTGGLDQGQVRDLAWMLEGTGIALLVAAAPADLHELTTTVLRPVAGLPLLHLDT